MTKEEMKETLVKRLEFWDSEIIECIRKKDLAMISEIKSQMSGMISISHVYEIITFDETLELEKAYHLL